MKAAFFVVYFLMGILQFAAVVAGITDWWGWTVWVAGPIALVLAYFPIVGTITGILGAVKGFEWSWTLAILLFTWHWIVFGLIMGAAGLQSLFQRRES